VKAADERLLMDLTTEFQQMLGDFNALEHCSDFLKDRVGFRNLLGKIQESMLHN
jgi:hypothetical protein